MNTIAIINSNREVLWTTTSPRRAAWLASGRFQIAPLSTPIQAGLAERRWLAGSPIVLAQ